MQVQSPMDYLYMKALREMLHCIGSWPYTAFGQYRRAHPFRHHHYLFFLWTMLLIGQITYMKLNFKELGPMELGQNCINILMNSISLQRITLRSTQQYREVIRMFVQDVHLFHFKDRSAYSLEVHKHVHRICNVFTLVLIGQVLISVTGFNLMPIINNYRAGMFRDERPPKGMFEVSIFFSIPFNYTTNLIGYIAVSIINLLFSFDVGLSLVFDITMSMIVFHTWGHLKIIDYMMRNFRRPEMKNQVVNNFENPPWYTPEENEEVAQLLKDIVNYHKLLKNFVNLTSGAFGLTLFVYYAFHQICCCILLLECSTLNSDAIGKYIVLTVAMVHELVQVSVVFELVAARGDSLADAVYAMPWECMGVKERRVMLIYLYNVQTPINFKALGMVPVGVQTMAAILKTSESYFLFLRNTAMNTGTAAVTSDDGQLGSA